MKKHYRSDKNCLNCGTIIDDKFCSSCGQENLELHEDFVHLALHSVGHYFHFESKFFNSFIPLFTKPGYLTKEYFAGKRASHLSPISMYIFISILFFFLFTANTNINEKDIREENATAADASKAQARETISKLRDNVTDKTVAERAPSKAANYSYTMLDQTAAPIDTVAMPHNEAATLTKPVAKKSDDGNRKFNVDFGNSDNVVLQSLQTKLQNVMNDEMSIQLFKNKLLGHLPKIMFILLPLFALILKLVHWRSSKYYVEHLIYSIHVHSFLFMFGSILILLSWLLPSLSIWIKLLGVLVALWYIYRSMRNIYRSTRWRTLYKFFLLFFAYGFLFTISALLVIVATLYTV
ncbi:MAG: DUF3667 domain-containing protein [Hymenobacteraceae bacterium]|nr:DUF3667 domain-containing protein [Hymenobacteraceae bacterium]